MKLLQALYCRSKYSARFVMRLLCALKATHAHEAGSGISALDHYKKPFLIGFPVMGP
jgi:hypothetical protein